MRMLLIEHYISSSPIHGLGVFTSRFVPRHTIVWQLNLLIDRIIHESDLIDLPQHTVELIRTHSEYFPKTRNYILGADGDFFMNHSNSPSLFDNRTTMLAARDLKPGDELTCDYRLVNVAAFNPEKDLSITTGMGHKVYQNGNIRRMPPLREAREKLK